MPGHRRASGTHIHIEGQIRATRTLTSMHLVFWWEESHRRTWRKPRQTLGVHTESTPEYHGPASLPTVINPEKEQKMPRDSTASSLDGQQVERLY